MKIYISGPITINKENYEKNFSLIHKLLEERFSNDEVINPLDYEVGVKKEEKWTLESWKKFIHKDIDLVWDCDKIVMLPGWEYSYGSTIELLAFMKHSDNSPLFFKYELNDFIYPEELKGYEKTYFSVLENLKKS